MGYLYRQRMFYPQALQAQWRQTDPGANGYHKKPVIGLGFNPSLRNYTIRFSVFYTSSSFTNSVLKNLFVRIKSQFENYYQFMIATKCYRNARRKCVIIYKSNPASPPIKVPLILMYCKSFPTLSSIFSTKVS